MGIRHVNTGALGELNLMFYGAPSTLHLFSISFAPAIIVFVGFLMLYVSNHNITRLFNGICCFYLVYLEGPYLPLTPYMVVDGFGFNNIHVFRPNLSLLVTSAFRE
jgi:hypothetical protein